MTKITLYDFTELERIIEDAAEKNEGEISDADLELLIQAQTGEIQKVEKLCGYMKHLAAFAKMAKAEAEKVRAKAKAAENRLENIKRYLTPYLRRKGGKVSVGIHTLSLRKSEGVVLVDGFNHPEYCNVETVINPDKKKIKESIKAGVEVKGAVLEQREGVVIK